MYGISFCLSVVCVAHLFYALFALLYVLFATSLYDPHL